MPAPPPPADRGALGRLDLRCPPLPQTLVGAVAMLEAPDAIEPEAVVALVERDPMLLAQLLKSVNSAYYGLSRTIASPARAVTLLGPVAVVGLAAGMGMARFAPPATARARAVADRVVRHSLATAYLARVLVDAGPAGAAPEGGAYTAGLLHDLGKLVLLHNAPDAAALYGDRALDRIVAAADGREHERLLFGCDHAEAGAVAAERSGFPEPLVAVIRRHHDAGARAGAGVDRAVGLLVRATAAASAGADALGFAAGPTLDADAAEDAWAEAAALAPPGVGGADGPRVRFEAEAPALRRYVGTIAPPAPARRTRLRLVR